MHSENLHVNLRLVVRWNDALQAERRRRELNRLCAGHACILRRIIQPACGLHYAHM